MSIENSTPEPTDTGEGTITEPPATEMMESAKIEELKKAIHDVLFAFEAHTKEMVAETMYPI